MALKKKGRYSYGVFADWKYEGGDADAFLAAV